ncbi:MAG: OmpH family outer membrane protein [Spirochaetales bacterium]|nr:OmpH family outer membrane protein [Spirochaetales bacterium]
MKKGLILLSVVILFSSTSAFAEQLSKIAVVDFQEIIDNFPSGSPAFSKLQILKDAYEEKRLEYLEDLNTKELELLDAKENADELKVARLEREIVDFKTFIRQWQEIKIKEIEITQNDFLQGRDIALDILKAIEYIAINEGYTIVLDANAVSVIWLSPEIDITELIVNRLKAMAR